MIISSILIVGIVVLIVIYVVISKAQKNGTSMPSKVENLPVELGDKNLPSVSEDINLPATQESRGDGDISDDLPPTRN